MSVRTKTLAVGASVPARGLTHIYVVPEGRTAIVKEMIVRNGDGAPLPVFLLMQRPGSGLLRFIGLDPMQNDQQVELLARETVLSPGDRLGISTFKADGDVSAIHYWVSGTELEGVAD